MSRRRVTADADHTMTDRLYYTDAFLTRFSARVVDLADDGRRIYLDQTAFYPTSGGQPHDLGTLQGVAVLDVVDEGDRVAHLMSEPLIALSGSTVGESSPARVGCEVEGVVDFGRRLDHMQQHTGQHLLSAVFADVFGWDTLSVHFGAGSSTLDLEVESTDPSVLRQAEQRANEVVSEDRAVTISFELSTLALGLRKASDREGTLRVVTIDGLDRSACGGTHVRTTGSIGPILLRRVEKVRKATRVEFLCGARAVRRARADYDALARMAQGLSCSIDELAEVVPAQSEQFRAMDTERRRLEESLAGLRARESYNAIQPDAHGIRRRRESRANGKADASRTAALAFCSLQKSVYLAVVAEPPAILFATSEDSGIDAGRLLKEALGAVGGRGGGGPRLAQGTVPVTDSVAALSTVTAMLGFGGIP